MSSRVYEAVKAIALCHNVTPVYESRASVTGETEYAEADQDLSDENRTYQASSPDEVSRPLEESRAPWYSSEHQPGTPKAQALRWAGAVWQCLTQA